jgi:hypothetical protein
MSVTLYSDVPVIPGTLKDPVQLHKKSVIVTGGMIAAHQSMPILTQAEGASGLGEAFVRAFVNAGYAITVTK